MTLREQATRIATSFGGRCTCDTMDVEVGCPWCRVYEAALRHLRLIGSPAGHPAPGVSGTAPVSRLEARRAAPV
ncbi:MAG TPA: hypothetical protein VGT40_16840 [Methylomirabilota bacterium]|jgi:hypothetical protein|nr:hypothetical protein [Methylomirabilota bacterium]